MNSNNNSIKLDTNDEKINYPLRHIINKLANFPTKFNFDKNNKNNKNNNNKIKMHITTTDIDKEINKSILGIERIKPINMSNKKLIATYMMKIVDEIEFTMLSNLTNQTNTKSEIIYDESGNIIAILDI